MIFLWAVLSVGTALAALAGSQLRTNNQNRNQPGANQQTHEMTVPNELIGCIIGKGGTKIAEIRCVSLGNAAFSEAVTKSYDNKLFLKWNDLFWHNICSMHLTSDSRSMNFIIVQTWCQWYLSSGVVDGVHGNRD